MHARIGVVYLGRHVDKSGTLALRQKLKAETGKAPQASQGKRKAQALVAAPAPAKSRQKTMDPNAKHSAE
ncbi:hypothetical protein SPRG_03524 [Saprolegnia parasitica CBS 223.65]|uniref:Uncharacterized protein n=1 Tax=Saprolegnia parasitica (strain CBS 223.65) TaxID=695850 RepID=A0A067CQT2_SAPPC|nr:hypothetical protein SPRG_03524 [Saprolegnia parasitica CBS 223.65]KDO31595.1 hypothetical protein SPRG_03524 [Saprolegnia parasitica CBS 223.65]|eukprot:XP_012197494.1 hypothetical protein SPRG_03524 [Saprolegnia parasitica CBS 223.65]